MATHTLNDEEYGNLINQREEAWKHIGELQAELARVKAEDSANRIAPLNALARAQLVIVRFAVANLPPETIKGWPTEALEAVAASLPALIDHSVDDVDLAITLRDFRRDCESVALMRATRREEKLAADRNEPTPTVLDPG